MKNQMHSKSRNLQTSIRNNGRLYISKVPMETWPIVPILIKLLKTRSPKVTLNQLLGEKQQTHLTQVIYHLDSKRFFTRDMFRVILLIMMLITIWLNYSLAKTLSFLIYFQVLMMPWTTKTLGKIQIGILRLVMT